MKNIRLFLDGEPEFVVWRFLYALRLIPVRTMTPACFALSRRQFAMVSEESVIGNMRPSDSVFSFTPRSSNQFTVSAAWKRVNAPAALPRRVDSR